MNCPSCKWPNKEGLINCDYCGTPLMAQPAPKRNTEAEVPSYGGAGAGKRMTEVEPPPARPARAAVDEEGFDPFRAPSPNTGPGRASPAAAGAAGNKRVTVFDPGDAAAPAPAAVRRGPSVSGGDAPGPAVGSGRRIVGWLLTFDGNPDGSSYIVREGRNVIGRDPRSDIAVTADEMVSDKHAYLIWRSGRARVADENSSNGTFLNEQDVLGQIEVQDNDVIRVGHTRFLVRLLDHEKVTALWKLPARGS